MTGCSLNAMLDKFAEGDTLAAEQLFRAYEPYLRLVVRRQLSGKLRAKFDSIDVVQSVWADILRAFRDGRQSFEDSDHLRAFLVKAARNRLIDRIRQHTPFIQREQPLSGDAVEALPQDSAWRPSQLAIADELWAQILAFCPSAHREVLILRRDGYCLGEIAERTGFHKSSVRRILYELAGRVARVRRESDQPG